MIDGSACLSERLRRPEAPPADDAPETITRPRPSPVKEVAAFFPPLEVCEEGDLFLPSPGGQPPSDPAAGDFAPCTHLPNAHDPFKPPARRWLRCDYLARHGRPPCPKRDDADTRAAWRFRRGLDACRTDADRDCLARRFPSIAEAHHVHAAAAPILRAELEARLLAGLSDEDVAAKIGLSPAGVAAYHAVFFDVRPHLTADAYIAGVVLGEKIRNGLQPDDHELLLKMFGYSHGAAGVDAYLDYLRDPPVVPASLDGLDLPALKALRDRVAFKAGVLALTTPAAAMSPETWQRLGGLFAPRQPDGADAAGGASPAAIRATLDVTASLSSPPSWEEPDNGDAEGQYHRAAASLRGPGAASGRPAVEPVPA